MHIVDLHIHTTATPHHSTWPPAELVNAALNAGLVAIAVADHNTIASVLATQAAGQQHGLPVVSGVEIDSCFPALHSPMPIKLWHTLIYGADPTHPALLALCDAVFERNRADAIRLQGLLAEHGFQIPGLDQLGRPANVADVGTALARYNPIEHNPGEDEESAGMRYILTQVVGGYQPVSVAEVIQVAHQAGGVAVLAHPGRSKGLYAIPADESDIAGMVAAGLDGIEVFYPAHSPAEQQRLAALAQKYKLLIGAGSDSHHPHQPLASWPVEPILPLLERVGVKL